jgi:hypothetical protein
MDKKTLPVGYGYMLLFLCIILLLLFIATWQNTEQIKTYNYYLVKCDCNGLYKAVYGYPMPTSIFPVNNSTRYYPGS